MSNTYFFVFGISTGIVLAFTLNEIRGMFFRRKIRKLVSEAKGLQQILHASFTKQEEEQAKGKEVN